MDYSAESIAGEIKDLEDGNFSLLCEFEECAVNISGSKDTNINVSYGTYDTPESHDINSIDVVIFNSIAYFDGEEIAFMKENDDEILKYIN